MPKGLLKGKWDVWRGGVVYVPSAGESITKTM